MVNFLIADDHPLFREALRATLQSRFEGADFVESDNLESTLAAILNNKKLNLVLLDLNMPGCEHFYGLIRVRECFPELPIIVISASDSATTISKSIAYGAKGFVSKAAAVDTLEVAIQKVLDGEVWIPEELKDRVDNISQEQLDIAAKVAELTPKQFQVLNFLQDGQLNKQIAFEMDVTEATVKAHISAIFKKLGVNTRTQAALLVDKLQSSI
jgi:DNA-binding NarL/FixJ family response regulator